MNNHADEIRAEIKLLGISQRETARVLELPERDFRGWCAGKECPAYVLLAVRGLGRDPYARHILGF